MIKLAQQEGCTNFSPEIGHAGNGPDWCAKSANAEDKQNEVISRNALVSLSRSVQ